MQTVKIIFECLLNSFLKIFNDSIHIGRCKVTDIVKKENVEKDKFLVHCNSVQYERSCNDSTLLKTVRGSVEISYTISYGNIHHQILITTVMCV